MKKFAIVCKNDAASTRVGGAIKKEMEDKNFVFDLKNPQLVIVVGGDGTFLSAIQRYITQLDECSFVGIHTGTLGFFTDYTLSTLEKCMEDVTTREPSIEEIPLLKIDVTGNDPQTYYALNEMRVESFRTQSIDVYADDTLIENFKGNGLCISTPTGSTGYNRSLKGAILEPGIETLQITEIAGIHHSKYRSIGSPLILRKDHHIRLINKEFKGVNLIFDRYNHVLEDGDIVECCLSDKKVKVSHYQDDNWFNKIQKLF